MPRPPRLEIAGGLYRLMSRGNGRKRIFFGDHDDLRFRRIEAFRFSSFPAT